METYLDFHRRSITDRDGFWREQAAAIDWQQPFKQVLDYSRPPFAKWFVGGTTNLCHNAVDRHLKDRAEQKALIYISTETGQDQDLHVSRIASQRSTAARRCCARKVSARATAS